MCLFFFFRECISFFHTHYRMALFAFVPAYGSAEYSLERKTNTRLMMTDKPRATLIKETITVAVVVHIAVTLVPRETMSRHTQ